MPDTRNVIIEYPVTLPKSTRNPSGRIAGERYAVRDATEAALIHPDALVIGYQGDAELQVGRVTADYLESRIEAIEADGWVAARTPTTPAPPVDIVLTSAARSVSTVSTQLVPAQSGRTGLTLANTGSVGIYVRAGATATTGDTLLLPGAIDDTSFAATTLALNAITATGTGTVYVRSVGQ